MRSRAVLVVLVAGVAAGGLIMRTYALNRRPVHTDEAVHMYKVNDLYTTGEYRYDPHEYHGPTPYYLTLPVLWLRGAADWREVTAAAFRIVPALAGTGLILLLVLVADGLGRPATIVAGVLTALSPALSFYSRYYIQEILLVFFTFLALAAGWRYVRSRRIGWALLAGAGVGLMHATKETCILAYGAAAGAFVVVSGWSALERRCAVPRARAHVSAPNSRRGMVAAVLAGLGVAILVSVTLFSNVFTNPAGPLDSLRAYTEYVDRAGAGNHIHPWWFYFQTLLWTHYPPAPVFTEGLIAILGVAGLVAGGVRRRVAGGLAERPAGVDLDFARFVGLYALLLTAAYVVIPYKTPWCACGFWHAWILLAGIGAAVVLKWAGARAGALAAASVVLVIGVAQLGMQAVRVNFRYYADERNPYVYAHPVTDVERLARYVRRLAAVNPHDRALVIKVLLRHEWPLLWYLRPYPLVGYWNVVPDDPDADLVLVSNAFVDEFERRRTADYHSSIYGLRRDESLVLYVHEPLREAFVRAAEAGRDEAP